MKKKVFLGLLIIIFSIGISKVQAFSGKVDSKGYITLPNVITIDGKKGTGTISVSSSANDYELSYQKVDVNESTYNSIINKSNELKAYSNNASTELDKKREKYQTLETEYTNIKDSTTATEEEKNTAKEKYETAVSEYNSYLNTSKTEYENLEREYYDLFPNYTSTWTKTNKESNNVTLTFNTTGKIYFVLYAKLTNGTDTFYDFTIYSNNIKDESNEGTATTGYTDAKYEWKKIGNGNLVHLNIKNISVDKNNEYYAIIAKNSSKLNISDYMKNGVLQTSSEELSKVVVIASSDNTLEMLNMEKYLELNQDMYLWLIEKSSESTEFVISGKKLSEYNYPKYADIFYATYFSNNSVQLAFNNPWTTDTSRKVTIKVGKITDNDILNDIKNNKSSGWTELLKYAKSSNGILNKKVTVTDARFFNSESIIDKSKISNNTYYYLYTVFDDENGKYYPIEGLTIAKASVDKNDWTMFFLGDKDFNWDGLKSSSGTTTTKSKDGPKTLPYTGTISLGLLFVIITITGIISITKYRKYKDI